MPEVIVQRLGCQAYEPIWQKMLNFTLTRDEHTPDELWLVEHMPVYTLGQSGKPEHLLNKTDIPLIQVDRGGQITYHGPGQVVVYTLINLQRRHLKVKTLVQRIEQSVINLLAEYYLDAKRQQGAPGVYVERSGGESAKIAALGLRIKNGAAYHGVSLNVDMDLSPFNDINPCGYPGMQVTQTKDCGISLSTHEAGEKLLTYLLNTL